MQYKISIIHPSRNRPRQALKTINEWLGFAKDKSQIEYILSVDRSDKDLIAYKRLCSESGIKCSIGNNKSAIEAINGAAKITTANILLVVSDDFGAFQDWDEKLLMEVEGKEDWILKTQDGIQDWIITLPILDRKYYDRFGYVYNPGYRHLFCDTEMTSVADLTGRKLTSDLFFEHRHYSVKKSRKDLINVKNDNTWKQGEKLYNERKAINFGL